jgi:hypothetical protein
MHIDRVDRSGRPAIEPARWGKAAWGGLTAVAVAMALSACATVGMSSDARGPYIGVFTGEFVDGLPLYRLPAITVVGTRRGLASD